MVKPTHSCDRAANSFDPLALNYILMVDYFVIVGLTISVGKSSNPISSTYSVSNVCFSVCSNERS